MDNVVPFKIDVQQKVLDDLRIRLTNTRWPDQAEDAGWSMGTNLEYLQQLTDYWLTTYDWRKQERMLNQFNHFTSIVNGVNIHFIHERGKGPNPIPLILTHGWPDSFYRFHKIIPMLTDPEKYGGKSTDSFDVIIPSIPGFGFSERKPATHQVVADLWFKLMTEKLGYKKFAAAGGDVGSGVTKALALQYPEALLGIHLTDVGYPTGQEDFSTMTEAEIQFAQFVQTWWFSEGAYAMIQMSKPQSIAYAFNDSPVGWAAWVLSFGSSGGYSGDIASVFGGRDELLTTIMIYWITQTAGSSARMYLENARANYSQADTSSGSQDVNGKSNVPAGIALFPGEAQFPKEWAERFVNVQRFSVMPQGGHFAAMEVPDLFAKELISFFAELRGS